jgi:hypothetical protein
MSDVTEQENRPSLWPFIRVVVVTVVLMAAFGYRWGFAVLRPGIARLFHGMVEHAK